MTVETKAANTEIIIRHHIKTQRRGNIRKTPEITEFACIIMIITIIIWRMNRTIFMMIQCITKEIRNDFITISHKQDSIIPTHSINNIRTNIDHVIKMLITMRTVSGVGVIDQIQTERITVAVCAMGLDQNHRHGRRERGQDQVQLWRTATA